MMGRKIYRSILEMKGLLLVANAFLIFSNVANANDWTQRYFENHLGARHYYLFVPDSVKPLSSLSPLVVMLHGCMQNARDFANGTRMNALAEKHRFSVLYPEQPESSNKIKCWNWFDQNNQRRDLGEPGILIGLIEQVLKENPNIDRSRVYVAGLSAGGAMAATLSLCYPELFAAAAIHSGVGYNFASNANEAAKAMVKGIQTDFIVASTLAKKCAPRRKEVVPTIVVHGKRDDVAILQNAQQIVDQLLFVAGLTRETSLIREEQGLGAILGAKDGYAYGYKDYGPTKDTLAVRGVAIEMLGHAWSGGDPKYQFNDKNSPNSSELIWDFFTSTTKKPVVASVSYNPKLWLDDFVALQTALSEGYANLEWVLERRHLNVHELSQKIRSELELAQSDQEAKYILKNFISKFNDSHLRLDISPNPSSDAGKLTPLTNQTAPETACQRLGGKEEKLGFSFDVPEDLGFSKVKFQGEAFAYTKLTLSKAISVGFVRIPIFAETRYFAVCKNEWENFRTTFSGVCDEKCEDVFLHHRLSNRLLSELQHTIRNVTDKKTKALVVDLRNNGGGTSWVEGVMQVLTPKTLTCASTAFIRHPHYVKRFQEEVNELEQAVKKENISEKQTELQARLNEAKQHLQEAQKPCDRSQVWNDPNFKQTCHLAVKRSPRICKAGDEYIFEKGVNSLPLFILVNDYTASASEDFVGRMKDNSTAKIIGTQTLGSGCGYTNGGINHVLPHSKITVRMPDCIRFLKDGTNEIEGIHPDIELRFDAKNPTELIHLLKQEIVIKKEK
jgi:poly(hydroxyalkanoate) depolymerase family esterase